VVIGSSSSSVPSAGLVVRKQTAKFGDSTTVDMIAFGEPGVQPTSTAVWIGRSNSNLTAAGAIMHLGADSFKFWGKASPNSVTTTALWAELSDGSMKLANGVGVNEFSNDGLLGGNSDLAVPTEKAVKTYVDANVATSFLVGFSGTLSSGTISVFGFGTAVSNQGGGWTTAGYFVAPANGVYQFVVVITESGLTALATNSTIELAVQYANSGGALYLPSTSADMLNSSRGYAKIAVDIASNQTFICHAVFAMSMGSAARPVINLGAGADPDVGHFVPFGSSKSFFAGKLWSPL
jgi:hypothetical protein